MRTYILAWSPRVYQAAKPRTVSQSYFTDESGYDDEDITKISKLPVGMWVTVDTGYHLVLRIK